MKLLTFLKSKQNRCVIFLLIIFALVIYLVLFDPHETLDPLRYNNGNNFITKGNDTSTLNYLSDVGVGALAGVLAIVISVTLMAVQFSSQEYGPKITEYYIKSFLFWSLIIVFMITILFNVILLNRFSDLPKSSNLMMVDISILLTMLCFLLLIPYFLFSVDQLRPDYIFKTILGYVDKKFIKTIKTNKDEKLPLNSGPVGTAIAIIEDSIKSNDRSIILAGIKEMHNCYNRMITRENDKYLSEFFIIHFSKIANIAILNSDTDTIKYVVDIFEKMVEPEKSTKMIYATDYATAALFEIAVRAADKKLRNPTIYVLEKLVEIIKFSKNSDSNKERLFFLGQSVSKQRDLEQATILVLEKLSEFEAIQELYLTGVTATQNKQGEASLVAIEKLVELVKKRYLFSWDSVPGDNDEKFKESLRDDFDIGWVENAEILKLEDDKSIRIFKDENSAEIIIDEKKEKASLKISDGRTLNLKVKKENGKLNIYKKSDLKRAKSAFDGAIEVILEATNLEIEVKYASEKLGEYMGKEISNGLKDISALGTGYLFSIDAELEDDLNKSKRGISKKLKDIFETNGFTLSGNASVTNGKGNEGVIADKENFFVRKEDEKLNIYKKVYCKFTVQKNEPNEIILEMKSCCIRTIKKFDDEKVRSYCERMSKHNEQGREELPVCTITYSYLTSAIKQIKSYLLSWENVPGNDDERLIRFLVDELGIKSAESAKIYKSDDGDTINIGMDDYTAKIMMDENKKKANLKISEDRIYDLIVKKENGKLNIYKQTNVKLNKPIEWNENGCHRLTFIVTTYLPHKFIVSS